MNRASILGSLRITLGGMAALALGVSYFSIVEGASALWVAVPLIALSANLGVSVATHPTFRRQVPLMVFHLALLAIVLLAATGRLTSFKGQAELAEGEVFDGKLVATQAGPLHAGGFEHIRFMNDGFSIRYAPGIKRAETRNPVTVFDSRGAASSRVIGDTEPLLVDGYRFYTSSNKGFSLVFRWFRSGGAVDRGVVNLPPYPMHEHRQANDWILPGTDTRLWTMLQMDTPPLDPGRETMFRKPDSHTVVARIGEARWELRPGDRIALSEGVLEYEGLSTWMGYRVFHDWTIPWLLAACLTAVMALGWHFWRKFASTPWNVEGETHG